MSRRGGPYDSVTILDPPTGEVFDLNNPPAGAGFGPQVGPGTMAARHGVPPFFSASSKVAMAPSSSEVLAAATAPSPVPSALPPPSVLLRGLRPMVAVDRRPGLPDGAPSPATPGPTSD
ncbi:hypothetical protein PR202_gb02725 [Eleusine coracana subsp. coracana]|uniref:Uncharacterized protein n=1 Tax=Eleusine coracana subsp. coracana TaxID=191504 RepID=A0AAV5DZF2_ELECO|nr:hypothetical protein PR202_gb02725 [Eleusine coracana subsp. coracana]